MRNRYADTFFDRTIDKNLPANFLCEQAALLAADKMLYLHEYEQIAEEIRYWRDDEWVLAKEEWEDIPEWMKAENGLIDKETSARGDDEGYQTWCVGIGRYATQKDGEIYLCALIDLFSRQVRSYTFGVYRSAELVEKALENAAGLKLYQAGHLILHSSQNRLYQPEWYSRMLEKYGVRQSMTVRGQKGGAAVVSTYFSQLMRRKGAYEFEDWQDAVDWLEQDIFVYNTGKMSCIKQ